METAFYPDTRGASPGRADGGPPGPGIGPQSCLAQSLQRVHKAWPVTAREASAGPASFARGVRHTAATACVPSVSLEAVPSCPPARPPHSAALACTLHPVPQMPAEGHSARWLFSVESGKTEGRSQEPGSHQAARGHPLRPLPQHGLAQGPPALPRPLQLCPPFPGRLQPPAARRIPARADSAPLVNCTPGGIKAGLACPDESPQSGV